MPHVGISEILSSQGAYWHIRLELFSYFVYLSTLYAKTDNKFITVISKCIRWNPEERFQTVEELKTALHDNISSDIGKPGFTLSSIHSDIPGFRTGKLWKMILAFFGYLSFFYCSMTSDFTNAKNGLPLTGLQLWHERFFVFL